MRALYISRSFILRMIYNVLYFLEYVHQWGLTQFMYATLSHIRTVEIIATIVEQCFKRESRF